MANGSAPPQAYTREVLGVAFNWLQTQSESVRKQATTPNALVSLYMRAQRQGPLGAQAATASDHLEAPVSAQNFMNDLRNLAEGLKQFEEPTAASTASVYAPPQTQSQHQPQTIQSQVAQFAAPFYAAPQPPAAPLASHTDLSAQSRAMIEEVRTQLNLSSSQEAINMMLAIAYKNLKTLLT